MQGNLRHWIEDPDCRDQCSIIYESGDRTAIMWNDIKEPVVIEERAVSMTIRQSYYKSYVHLDYFLIIKMHYYFTCASNMCTVPNNNGYAQLMYCICQLLGGSS